MYQSSLSVERSAQPVPPLQNEAPLTIQVYSQQTQAPGFIPEREYFRTNSAGAKATGRLNSSTNTQLKMHTFPKPTNFDVNGTGGIHSAEDAAKKVMKNLFKRASDRCSIIMKLICSNNNIAMY